MEILVKKLTMISALKWKWLMKWVGMLVLLVFGAWIVCEVSFVWQLRNRVYDTGFGYRYGRFNALVEGADQGCSLRVCGQTKKQWFWMRPENFQYRLLDVEWKSGSEWQNEGTGRVDTVRMEIVITNCALPLSKTLMADLLYGVPTNRLEKADADSMDFIYDLLFKAGKGQLPGPKHHNYHFYKPCQGYLAHSSIGRCLPYALYWWLVAWLIACYWMFLRKQSLFAALVIALVLPCGLGWFVWHVADGLSASTGLLSWCPATILRFLLSVAKSVVAIGPLTAVLVAPILAFPSLSAFIHGRTNLLRIMIINFLGIMLFLWFLSLRNEEWSLWIAGFVFVFLIVGAFFNHRETGTEVFNRMRGRTGKMMKGKMI